jgi:glucosamine 6-phosphate synthetase-like amidotransferase/phosphosugar isomerase protein
MLTPPSFEEVTRMCGIAGYSLCAGSGIDRTRAAQALLAGIAERGSDAVGVAFGGAGLTTRTQKIRGGASALLDVMSIPGDVSEVLLHVRDYTKGHPSIEENNHPIGHGGVVGIHNGVIANDEEIFARSGFARAHPRMTVDSEAIFALVDRTPPRRRARALEELHGSMAAAWLDERHPGALFLARGVGRPLWIGLGAAGLFFASTRETFDLLERYARTGSIDASEVPTGSFLTVVEGEPRRHDRFRPRRFEKASPPAVRAPEERASCMARLALIAATA